MGKTGGNEERRIARWRRGREQFGLVSSSRCNVHARQLDSREAHSGSSIRILQYVEKIESLLHTRERERVTSPSAGFVKLARSSPHFSFPLMLSPSRCCLSVVDSALKVCDALAKSQLNRRERHESLSFFVEDVLCFAVVSSVSSNTKRERDHKRSQDTLFF